MRIAIFSPEYPSQTSISFMFVHLRAKLYKEAGHEVSVFVSSNEECDYQFEGISVQKLFDKRVKSEIDKFDPDIVAVYYATFWMIPIVAKLPYAKVVWILGHEVLWTFRLTSSKNWFDWIKKRAVLVPRLIYQFYLIRKFLKAADQCVFVSNWLLRAAEKNILTRLENAVVIPNPVDTKLFSYHAPQDMTRGLSLRSLERSVYGLDIAIKAFSEVGQASLTICGRGRLMGKYRRMIERYKSNTVIRAENFKHDDLPALYHQFGFFVAPSRQETQGLAMCEAMACGLPVVASRVGGIPEFVRDGVDGYLVPPCKPRHLQSAVTQLLSDKERFLQMSKNARSHIESRCGAEGVIQRELEIIAQTVDNYRRSR